MLLFLLLPSLLRHCRRLQESILNAISLKEEAPAAQTEAEKKAAAAQDEERVRRQNYHQNYHCRLLIVAVQSYELRSLAARSSGRFARRTMLLAPISTQIYMMLHFPLHRQLTQVLNLFVDPAGTATPTKHLVVVITTDRGLCGSVNSSLARMARKEINAAIKAKSDIKLFVLGDKGRAQVR